jgi:WD40 repeat protein
MNDERGTMNELLRIRYLRLICDSSSFILAFLVGVLSAQPLPAQLETVDTGAPASVTWISEGQNEGHLALAYSPAGAFSPDSSKLAVAADNRVVLLDLWGGAHRVLKPRVEGVSDLEIHSASFLAPHQLLLLANGVIPGKGKNPPRATPTLAFFWDPEKDILTGKVNTLGESGGFGTPRLFPMIGYIGMYKENNFDLWHPLTGKGGRIEIPALTRKPNIYDLSPDGHWMILAQLEGAGGTDPTVVDLRQQTLVDSLGGQNSATLSISFSRNNQRVITACADGKVRLWSVGNWKLVATLSGHNGTVSWAEFSPDGRWIVSGGYDKTVRVWSAADGSLLQTLTEATEPVRTVTFSPNGEYIAASGDEKVWFWKQSKH